MPASRKTPKLADVARLANVSEATVSVVINGRVGKHARVSETTQEKIWQAVRELGYVANPAAKTLAGGSSMILAVFTFEPIFPIEHRNFYYPFLIGIEQEARQHGYDLLLLTSIDNTQDGRHIYRNGRNRLQLVDGAILLGAENNKQEVLALLEDRYPFVFVGRRDSPNDNISYAAADYAEGTAEIVDYLFQYQHQKIAYITSRSPKESSIDREIGVRRGFERNGRGLHNLQFWTGSADRLTLHDLTLLLQQGVTAFIAEDDLLGNQILRLAHGAGWQCPRDFSLAVLGDPLSLVEPVQTWTAFRIPRHAMGREAVRLLVQMLGELDPNRTAPYRTMLPCTFVPGTTVAYPPVADLKSRDA
ncbi:MAG: LacI family transcriptional regulator [Pleurocapsa minor GSE-CHR-MK-17-07R]|jgi:DNA-binding LacI/PurR family transcriptional regulator|nr:LacI family transcriptional regulator [Pleurocapsa minor GSE-CHR-MK 17-07R]